MKRAVSLVLALVLCFALAVPAAAAETDPKTAADLLNGLGLFKGTGTDANGAPEYQLERPATRIEALVMLIRLIGREDEALAFTGQNPFDDVPEWAARYAAFAYSEKLATGRSATKYDASGTAQAKDYLTFVLRALGYDDKSEDPPFTYGEANDFALKLGLVDRIYGDGEFLRGDAAVVSADALKQKKNGSDTTLIQSLVWGGAVTPNAAHDAGFTDVTAMPASEEGKKIEIAIDERNIITEEAVRAVLPQAKYIISSYQDRAGAQVLGISVEEYMRNLAIFDIYKTVSANVTIKHFYSEFPYGISTNIYKSSTYCTCILDGDLNIIAEHHGDTDSIGNGKAEFTRTYIDTSAVYDKMMERISAALAGKDSHTVMVDVNNPLSSWFDNVNTIYYYPVYIDGKEMTSDYRIAYDYLYEGESIEDVLVRGQFDRFYRTWALAYTAPDGTAHAYDRVLSEEGLNEITFYDKSGNRHFCLRVVPSAFEENDMVVMIYDTAGNLLGYTVI